MLHKETKRFGSIERAKEMGLNFFVTGEEPFGLHAVIQDRLGNELASMPLLNEVDTWFQLEIEPGVSFDFHYMDSAENDGFGASVECYEVYEYEHEGQTYTSADLSKEYSLTHSPDSIVKQSLN